MTIVICIEGFYGAPVQIIVVLCFFFQIVNFIDLRQFIIEIIIVELFLRRHHLLLLEHKIARKIATIHLKLLVVQTLDKF